LAKSAVLISFSAAAQWTVSRTARGIVESLIGLDIRTVGSAKYECVNPEPKEALTVKPIITTIKTLKN
jgi:hypothetical protein